MEPEVHKLKHFSFIYENKHNNPKHMEHYFQLTSGHRLHYEQRGNPQSQAPPIVFLNGLSQSTLAWHGVIEAGLAEFNCICVDLLFQGKSDSAPTYRSFEQHAADLHELLTHLGHGKYFLAGISYGGAVAQRFLAHFPDMVQKGFLISTFGNKDPYFDAIGAGWKKALLQGGYDLMFDVMLPFVVGRSYFINPVIPIDTLRASKASMSPATDDLLRLIEATEKSECSFLDRLKGVPVDTLVIQGEEDFLCSPEMGKAIADALPKGQFKLLEKYGHTLNLEAIPELASLIQEHCR